MIYETSRILIPFLLLNNHSIHQTMFSGMDMPASSAKNLESDSRINSPPLASLDGQKCFSTLIKIL